MRRMVNPRRIAAISLIVLLMAAVLPAASVQANLGWDYYRVMTISNSGAALTDHQVQVTITDTSNMAENGADLRFTDDANTEEYPYWVESWATNGAHVWVKVSSIPAGTSDIRMWYGNGEAPSKSDGDATFAFFDDFTGTSLDTDKWTFSSVGPDISATLSDGIFTVIEVGDYPWKRARWFSRELDITAPFVMHSRVTGYGAWRYDHVPIGYANSDNRTTQWNLWNSTWIYVSTSLASSGSGGSVGSTSWNDTSCDTFYDFIGEIYADGGSNLLAAGRTVTHSDTNTPNANRVMIGYWEDAQGYGCSSGRRYDHVFVRKYASAEPALGVGSEQDAGALDPFTPGPPTPVPSLTAWGMMVTSLMLGLLMAVRVLRMHRRPPRTGMVQR